jgi:aryl-alcohol dehydrogenase-like predicted oxidoreductase
MGNYMAKRRLGNTGFEIAPLVFGGNVFGWTVDEQASFALLDAFVAAGFNMIDTADVYSVWAPGNKGGESETIIGKWLKRRGGRDDIIIATIDRGRQPGVVDIRWALRRALAPHFDAEHGRGPVDGERLVCALYGNPGRASGRAAGFSF